MGFLGLVGFEITEVVEDVEVVDEAIEVDELDVEVVVIEWEVILVTFWFMSLGEKTFFDEDAILEIF